MTPDRLKETLAEIDARAALVQRAIMQAYWCGVATGGLAAAFLAASFCGLLR